MLNLILLLVFTLTIITSVGLSNFKLDASSDALVLESDESLKTYREAEDEFGDSSFLIVTYEPKNELFSEYSLKPFLFIVLILCKSPFSDNSFIRKLVPPAL